MNINAYSYDNKVEIGYNNNDFEKQLHVLNNCINYSLLRFVENRLNFYIKFIQAEAVVAKEIFGLTKVLIVRYIIATGALFLQKCSTNWHFMKDEDMTDKRSDTDRGFFLWWRDSWRIEDIALILGYFFFKFVCWTIHVLCHHVQTASMGEGQRWWQNTSQKNVGAKL